MSIDSATAGLLTEIYGTQPPELVAAIEQLIAAPSAPPVQPLHGEPLDGEPLDGEPLDGEPAHGQPMWTERDVVLITYADQVRDTKVSPLRAQRQFLLDHAVDDVINCVHLLPFCPYSSDDGFSVIDYLAVDPDSGDWDDIGKLHESFDLMFDLVLNHCSQHSRMFQGFLAGEPAFANFFIDQDPGADLSQVVRPRSLPLLSQYQTASGTKHIWTTFSSDQVDLNYANPRVLAVMLEILVEYARRGARIIRLDAIAYLWKEIGTNCIHLPQTHAVVKLMRRVLDQAAPGTLVLTETNVPHDENISYFGNGTDEAHMVYQFSLPPLLLDAVHSGQTAVLKNWLATLAPPSELATFFNFTASHDGIGVRPLEGIVPPERVQRLADIVRSHDGLVNTRRNADGSDSPYELNITYLDAIAQRASVSAAEHSRRFLATQAIMLSMQGVPAVYFHSLVGTPNDLAGVAATGQNRRINRHKYRRDELEAALSEPAGLQRRVFDGYRKLLAVRRQQPAFHPAAAQRVLDLPGDGLLGFIREQPEQRLAVLANLSHEPRVIDRSFVDEDLLQDVLAVEKLPAGQAIPMRPFQVRWLTP